MTKIAVMFADGFEEVEALTTVDLLRRAGYDVDMVSVNEVPEVTGSHKIKITADSVIDGFDFDAVDMIILPGGMPGTLNLGKTKKLTDAIIKFSNEGKRLGAICAAPTVFGSLGILNGRKACCYPEMEDGLTGATPTFDNVTVDGNIITSRGVGTAIDFALTIISEISGAEASASLAEGIVYKK